MYTTSIFAGTMVQYRRFFSTEEFLDAPSQGTLHQANHRLDDVWFRRLRDRILRQVKRRERNSHRRTRSESE